MVASHLLGNVYNANGRSAVPLQDAGVVEEGRDLVKQFGELVAVDRVTVPIRRGEIGVLLGENGAGKSTYLKMLNGYLKPSGGTIYYEGKETRFGSARHAVRKKIYTIYQSSALIDLFTVKENMALSFPTKSSSELRAMIEKYGKDVDLNTRVALLSGGVKQRLEITRALESDAKVLLLDEPTSVLAYEERDRLFKDLQKLGEEKNLGILITTHKLRDVIDYCKRVTVLKQGKVVLQKLVSETSLKELTIAMFGASEDFEEATVAGGVRADETSKILDVEHLVVRGTYVQTAVQDATFSMYKGEILGIIGVAGNGQLELADAVYGLRKPLGGKIAPSGPILKQGRRLKIARVAFTTDDPVQVGLAPNLSVKDNFGISLVDQLSRGPFVKWDALEKFSDSAIADFEIKCDSPDRTLRELSGGNIQKVLAARELGRDVDILIATHPAKGLDLHTTLMVYRHILGMAKRGVAVLLISEDIDEVTYLSDRIGVMYEGKLSTVKSKKDWTKQEIGALMTGAHMVSGAASAT